MRRGDLVVCVARGDYGKPRPAVVVQSDYFNDTHPSIVVCLLTSTLLDLKRSRVLLEPNSQNGRQSASSVMVDKVTAISRDRIKKVIGHVSQQEMAAVDAALRLWLGLPAA